MFKLRFNGAALAFALCTAAMAPAMLPTAAEAVIGWTLEQPGNEDVRSVNAVVGETNDGRLNDIRSRPRPRPRPISTTTPRRRSTICTRTIRRPR